MGSLKHRGSTIQGIDETKKDAAPIKATIVEKPQTLTKQYLGVVPSGLTLALVAWAVAQEVTQPVAMRMTCLTALYITVVSYVYCDYWLWMLHCFLDRKENLESRLGKIAEFAFKFQDHHDRPVAIFSDNHLGEIDELVQGVAGMGLLLGAWTSPATKLIVVGIILFGSLGSLNHFYGHCITHQYKVPALYKYGQLWGLLPTAKHHKTHHTAPFEMNWNFLNGFYKIYEAVYFATGSPYWGLFVMFYTCNPIAMQAWALKLNILA